MVVPLSLSIQGLSQSQTVGISDLIDDLNAGGDIPSFLAAQNNPNRGDIRVELTSPQGTVSVLLPNRGNDFINDEGYSSWPFMSVHHWGEDPTGRWTLRVTFNPASFTARVQVTPQMMRLYGTTETPAAVASIPSTCHPYCARGCSGPTAADCDVCRDYRLNSTLECVTACPQGTTEQNNYCFGMPTATTTPSATETAGTTTTDPITTIAAATTTADTTTVNVDHETTTAIPTDATTPTPLDINHEQTTGPGVVDTTAVSPSEVTDVSTSASPPTTNNIPATAINMGNNGMNRNSSSVSRSNFLINLALILFVVALVKLF